MMDVDKLKLYARVDHDAEDALLEGILTAAETAVQEMTGKIRPTAGDDAYDICVLQLAAHWYQSRTPTESGTIVQDVPYTLQLLLNLIAMSSKYPEVPNGTGEST